MSVGTRMRVLSAANQASPTSTRTLSGTNCLAGIISRPVMMSTPTSGRAPAQKNLHGVAKAEQLGNVTGAWCRLLQNDTGSSARARDQFNRLRPARHSPHCRELHSVTSKRASSFHYARFQTAHQNQAHTCARTYTERFTLLSTPTHQPSCARNEKVVRALQKP